MIDIGAWRGYFALHGWLQIVKLRCVSLIILPSGQLPALPLRRQCGSKNPFGDRPVSVTIDQIAQRAGVSTSTVARVLRGDVKGVQKRSAKKARDILRISED